MAVRKTSGVKQRGAGEELLALGQGVQQIWGEELGLPAAVKEAVKIKKPEHVGEKLIRLKEVLQIVPVAKSTFYQGIKTGRYPAPVHHLGPRISAWRMSEIMQLVNGGGEL